MKQINLLPASVALKARGRTLAISSGLALLLAGLSIGALWWYFQTEQKNTHEQLTQYQDLQNEIKKREAASQNAGYTPDLIERVKQLNTLSTSEVDWSKVFQKINQAIPDDTKITSYSVASSQSNTIVKLGGESPSNLSFAVFVESLRGNKVFSSVKVDGFNYNPTSGVVIFSITTQLPANQANYPSS